MKIQNKEWADSVAKKHDKSQKDQQEQEKKDRKMPRKSPKKDSRRKYKIADPEEKKARRASLIGSIEQVPIKANAIIDFWKSSKRDKERNTDVPRDYTRASASERQEEWQRDHPPDNSAGLGARVQLGARRRASVTRQAKITNPRTANAKDANVGMEEILGLAKNHRPQSASGRRGGQATQYQPSPTKARSRPKTAQVRNSKEVAKKAWGKLRNAVQATAAFAPKRRGSLGGSVSKDKRLDKIFRPSWLSKEAKERAKAKREGTYVEERASFRPETLGNYAGLDFDHVRITDLPQRKTGDEVSELRKERQNNRNVLRGHGGKMNKGSSQRRKSLSLWLREFEAKVDKPTLENEHHEVHKFTLPRTLKQMEGMIKAANKNPMRMAVVTFAALLAWSEDLFPRSHKWAALTACMDPTMLTSPDTLRPHELSVYQYDKMELNRDDRERLVELRNMCPWVLRSYVTGALKASANNAVPYRLQPEPKADDAQEAEYTVKIFCLENTTQNKWEKNVMFHQEGVDIAEKYPRGMTISMDFDNHPDKKKWRCGKFWNLLRFVKQ